MAMILHIFVFSWPDIHLRIEDRWETRILYRRIYTRVLPERPLDGRLVLVWDRVVGR